MLRLDKINGGQISGLDSNELGFMEDLLSGDISDNIFDQFTGLPVENIFEDLENPDLSVDQLNDISVIEDAAKSKHTEKQTNHYIKMFKNFLILNNLPVTIETMPQRYLQSYLRLFFAKLRKKDGGHYSVKSLVCMRAAFHRYLSDTSQITIIGNAEFCAFDKTFKAAIAESLKSNKKMVSEGGNGFAAIEPEDLTKLQTYFNRETPERLQDEVFFSIIYYFGFRGREWIRSLNKSSLISKEGSNGEEYIDVCKEAQEKNVRVGNESSIKQTVMAENKDDESKCPVHAVKLYLSKLPSESDVLFPKSKSKFTANEWYCTKEVLGKNTLQDMMKRMSKRAGLQNTFTNHCIRSTVVTSLRRLGYTEEQCMRVTGQKRIESINRYDKRKAAEKTTLSEKKNVSNALTFALSGKRPPSTIDDASLVPSSSASSSITYTSYSENHVTYSAPPEKKMKIVADAKNNVVTITFDN